MSGNTHNRDDCDDPDCGTCMHNGPDEPDHRVELAEQALSRWVDVARSGGTLESKLLADPIYRREYTGKWAESHRVMARADFATMDAILSDPTCSRCGSSVVLIHAVHGWVCEACLERLEMERQLLDICEKGQHSFSWRMGLDSCRYCGLPSGGELPDYEALGYPETEFGSGDLDYAAYCIAFASRGIAAQVIAYRLGATEKDIRRATDNG